jgi:hypothetical protein
MEMGVFSASSMPRSCLEDKWGNRVCYHLNVSLCWCEMAASLGVQAYVGDISGSFPDHHNKANIATK